MGGVAAIAAILMVSKMMQRKLNDDEQKRFLKRYTRGQIIWVAFSMMFFAMSYELSSGWLAPVTVYSVFLIGLVIQQIKLMKYMKYSCPGRENKGQFYGWLGLIGGASIGFGATISGLINSGRMLL